MVLLQWMPIHSRVHQQGCCVLSCSDLIFKLARGNLFQNGIWNTDALETASIAVESFNRENSGMFSWIQNKSSVRSDDFTAIVEYKNHRTHLVVRLSTVSKTPT
jgi:hypothetical protein